MVRINLVLPKYLADQHLIAEYVEILMLVSTARIHPVQRNLPPHYVLGPGHITFFKDKLGYLKQRHERLKVEMRRRGFRAEKSISLRGFPASQRKNWRPTAQALACIRKRLLLKIRRKPGYYRYCGEARSYAFFRALLNITER